MDRRTVRPGRAACALALTLALGALGCGGNARPGDDATDGGNGGGSTAPKVPDPGTKPLGFDWADAEPNDTPEQATPLGVASDAWIATWVNNNSIGGADKADFFVFRSGPNSTTFHSSTCWSGGTNLLDMYLYKVVDGQPLTLLSTNADTGTSCENTTPDVTIEPNTKYLLELRAMDGSGQYAS